MGIRDVLVVDDEEDLVEVFVEVLEIQGLQPIGVTHLEELPRQIQERHPGTLILDERMHDGSGLKMLERLSKQSVQLPMTLMATGDEGIDFEKAFRLGVSAILFKPFNVEKVSLFLENALAYDPQFVARKWLRFPVGLQALILGEPVQLIDICAGGCSIYPIGSSTLSLFKDVIVRLNLTDHQGRELILEVAPTWFRDSKVGMKFIASESLPRTDLMKFISNVAARQIS